MKFSLSLTGVDEARRQFRALPAAAQAAAVERVNEVAEQAAADTTQGARSKWGRDTGKLHDAGARVLRRATPKRPSAKVGFPARVAHAVFWEHGSAVNRRGPIPVLGPAIRKARRDFDATVGLRLSAKLGRFTYYSARVRGR